MNIHTKVKWIMRWQKFLPWTIFIVILLLFFVIVYVLNKTNIMISLNQKFTDPGFAGVFGSLLGAIVGGILSLITTLHTNKKQGESKSAIVRKNIIYTPLYNELVCVKSVLNENPYPHYFTFDLGPQTMLAHPQFNAWKRIKSDTRIFQVPKYLADSLEMFEKQVIEYMDNRAKATNELNNTINNILGTQFSTTCTIRNIGECLIGKVLSGDNKVSNYSHYFKDALNPKVELTEKDYELLVESLMFKSNELDEVKKLKYIYTMILDQLNSLIAAISLIIVTINFKYESNKIKF